MEKYNEYIISGILAVIITHVFMPVLTKIAVGVNLIDKPNFRKIHNQPIPLVGGISIMISSFVVLFLDKSFYEIIADNKSILISALVIFIMGTLDDRFDLNAKLKLLIQISCAIYLANSGIRITSLYGFWGMHTLSITFQYIITVVLITGLVNSFNLMDGVDGLAGGLAVLGFILFFILNLMLQNNNLAIICVVIACSTLVFLKHNFSKNKIFMGDAGSLTLGFILAGMGIQIIEKLHLESHPSQNWILFLIITFFSIPTFDSLRVYKGRIKKGTSPFKADKTHIHHLFLNIGISHRYIAVVIVSILSLFLFMVFEFKSFFSITLIISFLISSFTLIARMLNMLKELKDWKQKIHDMETM